MKNIFVEIDLFLAGVAVSAMFMMVMSFWPSERQLPHAADDASGRGE
jgi:hypothetical protein